MSNIESIIIVSVIALRAIIALPLTFAAVHHFDFLKSENTWIVVLVAYVSIFAVEAIMTLFSFLSANFRKAKLQVAYNVSISFVGLFFLLNAWLLWEMKTVYPTANFISLIVWQVLNLASVALAESLGFIHSERVQKDVTMKEAKGEIPANVMEIKLRDMVKTEKVRLLWATGYFGSQGELAKFLVVSQAYVSASLNEKKLRTDGQS